MTRNFMENRSAPGCKSERDATRPVTPSRGGTRQPVPSFRDGDRVCDLSSKDNGRNLSAPPRIKSSRHKGESCFILLF